MTPLPSGHPSARFEDDSPLATAEARIAGMSREIARLRTEKEVMAAVVEDLGKLSDELAAALREAKVNMESWAAYAMEYFQEKHDLASDLAACDEALTKWEALRG